MPSTLTKLLIRAMRPNRSALRFTALKTAAPLAVILMLDAFTLPHFLPTPWTFSKSAYGVTAYVIPLLTLAGAAFFHHREGLRRMQRKRLRRRVES